MSQKIVKFANIRCMLRCPPSEGSLWSVTPQKKTWHICEECLKQFSFVFEASNDNASDQPRTLIELSDKVQARIQAIWLDPVDQLDVHEAVMVILLTAPASLPANQFQYLHRPAHSA